MLKLETALPLIILDVSEIAVCCEKKSFCPSEEYENISEAFIVLANITAIYEELMFNSR